MPTPQLVTASLARRGIAALIDWTRLWGVTGGISMILAIVLHVLLPEARADGAAELIFRAATPLGVALSFAYFVPCWALKGRSLGMALLKLHVIERDAPNLGGISWGLAAMRASGYLFCGFTLGIGFLVGLHDRIAYTDAVTASAPPQQGYPLADTWRGGAAAYLGTTVADFPNLFLMPGPNTGLGHSSMTFMVESQMASILDALHTMTRQHLSTVAVRPTVQAAYNVALQRRMRRTVWSTGCGS